MHERTHGRIRKRKERSGRGTRRFNERERESRPNPFRHCGTHEQRIFARRKNEIENRGERIEHDTHSILNAWDCLTRSFVQKKPAVFLALISVPLRSRLCNFAKKQNKPCLKHTVNLHSGLMAARKW